MGFDHRSRGHDGKGKAESRAAGTPGKRTLSEGLAVQRKVDAPEASTGPAESIHQAAQTGVSGPGSPLPYADRIQSLFGRHNISQVEAHVGGEATAAAQSMGAQAYATGNQVAFRDMPSLHLAAHEAAHVVQQRAGVHLAGGVGQEGDPHERHADQVADLVVQGKSAEGLLDAYAGASASHAGAHDSGRGVQRKVDTNYGEWFDDNYTISRSGSRRGIKIDLRFKPKPNVDAELIGMTQTARTIKAGSPYSINGNATTRAHSIQSGDAQTLNATTGETDEGAHIDQADYNRNPLYAAEGAPAGDTRLDQTLPDPDVTKKNDWGRHGFRYTDSSGALQEQDALLSDETGLNNGATDSAQIYETTALAIKGNQKDSYYGSVEWGWRTDSAGTFTKLPLKVISQGVPSSTFMKSAELWNNGTTATGGSTLDLPTVAVKVTTAPVTQKLPRDFIGPPLQIPAATRVQVVTPATATVNGTIRVVDGPFVGNSLDIDAADMANLRDER
jgi:hypothetical protein